MATFAFCPVVPLNEQLSFTTHSSSKTLKLSATTSCPNSRRIRRTFSVIGCISPHQKSTGSTETDCVVVAASSTDSELLRNSLSIPSYDPSLITLLLDLFRQDLRNVQVGRMYGPVYQVDNLFGPVTMITDYNAVVEVARKPHLFAASGAFPTQFINLLGHDAILFNDGSKHKRERNRISPAFLPSSIPSFHSRIVHHARGLFNSLATNVSTKSRPIEATHLIKSYFLDLIIKLTMSVDQNLAGNDHQHSNNYNKTSTILSSLFVQFANGLVSPTFMPAYHKAIQASQTLRNELRSIFLRRLRSGNARAKLRDVRNSLQDDKVGNVLRGGCADLISVLIATSSLHLPEIDDNAVYDSKEGAAEVQSLVDMLAFLWFAGYTTQSGTLLCVIMEIFSDAPLLERLQHEQTNVRELTPQSIMNDMPLLSSVLTESMRINSAATLVFRRTTEDVSVLGYFIPKGTVVGIDYISANNDPSIFQDPDDFTPDRFANNPELARKVLLFGAPGSPHYCIGASLATVILKTTLAVMIREFDIDVKPWKRRSIKTLPETVPRDGVWVRKCEHKCTKT